MASWESYFQRYKRALPSTQSIYGDIAASTAGTYGSAATQAGRAFGGSATSGAYGGQQADIFTQRASKLSGIMAGLKENERRDLIQLLSLAQNQANQDKSNKLAGLGGLGKFAGTALGAGISLIPGGQPLGLGIMGASSGVPMGGLMPQQQGAGSDYEMFLKSFKAKYPDIYQQLFSM